MAQITVPGSTAESTNVTPVSAEVPTGVTLPEQIDDFTAQTNAAEPSGPTVDAAQDLPIEPLKSSKAPTNYFTPNILRKSWSRLVVSVVHLDALAFPVVAT